ncbi:MAG TPA: tetratricopeptide repeat protein [Thermoanaerobaculia bacterium]|jgi:tetratricopeptide (TPR) repeat protein|nr:tetratricopeptide repeat protein [Thermoanaerobaculia bacterium]HXM77813.1 tetratricopeptide repeat protein [Thermoanaerobaculia bacterium]
MAKRWTESELRFLKDNVQKMSVQALADVLSVRIDELERKMEKLGLLGGTEAPAAKKAQTLKELSRHTENARKDFDRGVAALQKKKFEEAERNFTDLIQKYPDEKELVDRSRVYLSICERYQKAAHPAMTEPEEFYYAAVVEKNRGNVSEAIEHLKRAAKKNGGGRVDFLLACCYAQTGDSEVSLLHLKKAIEEDQRHRILARHDRDFDPLRETPEFQELLAS